MRSCLRLAPRARAALEAARGLRGAGPARLQPLASGAPSLVWRGTGGALGGAAAAAAGALGHLGGAPGAGAAGRRGWAACAAAEGISEGEFHKYADATLGDLQERIEEFVEDCDLEDADVEYSMGVITIKLGERGTFVLNKQAPNKQIWLSSPISGPIRYDYDPEHTCWVYRRDGHTLRNLLAKELSQLCGAELCLDLQAFE